MKDEQTSQQTFLWAYDPKEQNRSRSFVTSFTLQFIALALLFYFATSLPPVVIRRAMIPSVTLIAPEAATPKATRPLPAPARPTIALPTSATPAVSLPAPPRVPIEQPSIAHLPEIQHVAPTPAPVIHTNVFSATNTSTADAAKSRPSVQAAGFGDPNGIPSSKTATRSVIPVNAFGAEPGAGGTGRARSVQTVQTGFTSGPAGTGTGTATGPRTVAGVRPTQFDQPQAPTTTQNKPAPQRSARITPVEIQSKPAPVYTEQARQKHIEGEVLLDVVFTASGEVRIIGVARGLGYGLDEAAIKAARLIRFSPAMRDGERVDYPATLHITFALS